MASSQFLRGKVVHPLADAEEEVRIMGDVVMENRILTEKPKLQKRCPYPYKTKPFLLCLHTSKHSHTHSLEPHNYRPGFR